MHLDDTWNVTLKTSIAPKWNAHTSTEVAELRPLRRLVSCHHGYALVMTNIAMAAMERSSMENSMGKSVRFQWSFSILVGGLEHFLFSHILGIIIPIDLHIFQRGRYTTNQHRYVTVITRG